MNSPFLSILSSSPHLPTNLPTYLWYSCSIKVSILQNKKFFSLTGGHFLSLRLQFLFHLFDIQFCSSSSFFGSFFRFVSSFLSFCIYLSLLSSYSYQVLVNTHSRGNVTLYLCLLSSLDSVVSEDKNNNIFSCLVENNLLQLYSDTSTHPLQSK